MNDYVPICGACYHLEKDCKCEGQIVTREEYTCNECVQSEHCDYAWDLYNTGGDCLASR